MILQTLLEGLGLGALLILVCVAGIRKGQRTYIPLLKGHIF